jgi:hypothetical protein
MRTAPIGKWFFCALNVSAACGPAFWRGSIYADSEDVRPQRSDQGYEPCARDRIRGVLRRRSRPCRSSCLFRPRQMENSRRSRDRRRALFRKFLCETPRRSSRRWGAAVKLMHYHLSDAYSSSDPEKSEAFRLPLAKKMSTQVNHAPAKLPAHGPPCPEAHDRP